jgi:hypothetical protein
MKLLASMLLHPVRLFCTVLVLTFLIPQGQLSFTTAAQAQERSEGVGLLRFLFPRREQPRQDRVTPPAREKKRPAATARRASQPPAPPAEPVIEKADSAKRVLVIGDFVASGLSEGLDAAYAQNPDIAVIDRTNGSSGLVRDDHYNWPGNIAAVIDEMKPAAVIVMIGSNDRQQMVVGGKREDARTETWTAEYERRVTALAKSIRDKELPLFWVGNLPFKSSAMSSDMIAFNDIYRRIATEAGGEFIDVWDGFVDESGTFAAAGPDMNGQPAQLRASDGINVTRQGRRKIAFYVEKPLARQFGLGSGLPEAGIPDGDGVLPAVPGEVVPAVIDRTAPMAIDDFAGDGTTLLGATFKPVEGEARNGAEKLKREGIAPAGQPGRADDFAARRSASPSPVSTGAITR